MISAISWKNLQSKHKPNFFLKLLFNIFNIFVHIDFFNQYEHANKQIKKKHFFLFTNFFSFYSMSCVVDSIKRFFFYQFFVRQIFSLSFSFLFFSWNNWISIWFSFFVIFELFAFFLLFFVSLPLHWIFFNIFQFF